MIFDANKGQKPALEAASFDVCILGAGIAGIILALTLAERGFKVVLLEGGGLEPSEESRSLYDGDVTGLKVGDPDLDRLRFFGGTSGHWAGHCMALDAYDFDEKPYAEMSGWPITQADLLPYLSKARSWLESGEALGANDPLADIRGPMFNSVTKPVSQSSAEGSGGGPTRFGFKYRQQVIDHPNIYLVIHANALELNYLRENRRIEEVEYRSLDGRLSGLIGADTFVLCLGGLEIPRFLLNASNSLQTAMGDGFKHVGRYLGWHPSVKLGNFILDWDYLRKEQPRLYEWASSDEPEIAYLVPSPDHMKKTKTLNFLMHLGILNEPDIEGTSWSNYVKSYMCKTDLTARLAEGMYGEIWQCGNFRYDGELYLLFEQFPLAESRVTLSENLDAFGQRKIEIDSHLSVEDFRTIHSAALELGRIFAEREIGRVKLESWVANGEYQKLLPPRDIALGSIWHAMGTTRMSQTTKNGVVDPNLRVFGTSNLFVCGSSVFPTFGQANPTLSIAQLTLRLSDHLSMPNA